MCYWIAGVDSKNSGLKMTLAISLWGSGEDELFIVGIHARFYVWLN